MRLFNLFGSRRRRLDRDLARELAYHVDRRASELVASGFSGDEARRRARLEFGGVAQVQEDVRDTWTWRWLDALLADLRYSVRSLSRSWGFTFGTVGVLALGIGANSAIFSLVNSVLLRPLAYPQADRIVALDTVWTNTGRAIPEVSGPDFLDWQVQNDVFEAMAYSFGEDDLATVVNDRAEFANVRYVSPDFFRVFGQPPAAGRLLSTDDTPREGNEGLVAVVGLRWAEAHFGRPGAAVGRTVTVYGTPRVIVGVAAAGFLYPGATDVWAPAAAPNPIARSEHALYAVARLKPGVPLARAEAQVRTIAERLAAQHPENQFKSVAVTSLHDQLTGTVRTTLWVLMAAVAVVLLIACANVAHILIARSAGRTRELALRAALGAGRGRVMRQLLTESAVLAGAAAIMGVLLAMFLVNALIALSPAALPRMDEVRVDWTVLLFALALSAVSTFAFGLLPAVHASRLDLSEALKQGGAKGGTVAGGRLRSTLVVAEVALSVVLLAASALLLRSFLVLNQVDLGFVTERVVLAYTQYVVNSPDDQRRRIDFYNQFLERVRAVPGVTSAAGMAFLPLGKEPRPPLPYAIEGEPADRPGEMRRAEFQAVTPGYFRTLDIPLRSGRDFNEGDGLGRPAVAIVNESLAREAFGTESPLGRRIRLGRAPGPLEIVGVAANTRWRDPSRLPPPEVFVASAQGAGGSLSLVVRTTLDEQEIASTLRTLLHEANASVPARFETMEELFAGALAYPRFRTQLVGAFGSVAALLAAVGIFSVLAYMVGQRTRELALRRAVGAGTRDLVRLIVGHGMRFVAAGLVLGLAGALVLSRLLEELLFEITPWDASSYAGAAAALGLTALAAMLVPALRAAKVDPLVALRQE